MEVVPGLRVAEVIPGSLAEEMEIEPGDTILSINGQNVVDLIDFQFLASDDYLEIEVEKNNGEIWRLELDKEPGEDFGIEFVSVSAQGIKRCRNRCLFCFVDQTPPKMRPSLYEKDDDYRLSLTQGSFVTLTNLSEEELDRIIKLHLSPLYISVHATDPEVRVKLLQNPRAARIMEQLKALAEAGIVMHTQVVLVPGLNDQRVLERTVADLQGLWPQVQSVAVVPVGLTSYREGLTRLSPFNTEAAREVIEWGTKLQEKFRQELGVNFLYFSDEFYVEAEWDFPSVENYDDFAQVENGVGLSRLFLDEIDELIPKLPKHIEPRKVHVVTGVSAKKTISRLLDKVTGLVQGLEIKLHVLENHFFGPSVTVAGLLTGSDLLKGLRDLAGEEILIPRVMLKADEEVFLDDLTVEELARRLGARITIVRLEGIDFWEKILGQEIPLNETR